MNAMRRFVCAAALAAMAVVCPAWGQEGPRLDLRVRKVECAPNLSGWRFFIENNGSRGVKLSDLQIKLWIHGAEPVEAYCWVPGKLMDARGAFLRGVEEVKAEAGAMARYRAYPPDQKADFEIRVKTGDEGELGPGEKWQDGFFEYRLVNWGPVAPGQDYTNAEECGDTGEYGQNGTVGLYYQGRLVEEWVNGGEKDGATGKDPLPGLDLSGVRETAGPITSPEEGEQVCGQVQIAVRPQGDEWEVQWTGEGKEEWKGLGAQKRGEYWVAAWETGWMPEGSYWIRLFDRGQGKETQRVGVKVGAPKYERTYELADGGIPEGLAVTKGELYVLDGKNGVLQVVGSNGLKAGEMGGYGSRLGELNQAKDVAADVEGTLYVADGGNGRVQMFGERQGVLGEGIVGYPTAVKSASSGVYVLDGKVIHRFSGNGEYLYTGRLGESGDYKDFAVDETGMVYALNAGSGEIEAYAPGFERKGNWQGPQGGLEPTSVGYSGGRLWVAAAGRNQVVKLGMDGNRLATWGIYGTAHGQFDQPGEALGDAGGVYVSDRGNKRVEKFSQAAGNLPLIPSPVLTPETLSVRLSVQPALFDPQERHTTFVYDLSRAADVSLAITGTSGEIVFQQAFPAGNFGAMKGQNQVVWDGRFNGNALPEGNYTLTLQAKAGSQQVTAQTVVEVGTDAVPPAYTATQVFTPVPTETPVPKPTFTATPTPTRDCHCKSPVPTVTRTHTPVPPTPTPTPMPPTFTFTPVPPTATFTPIPPTATFTPVAPTATPVPSLRLRNVALSPASFPADLNPKVLTGSFELNIPARVEIAVVSKTSGGVCATLNMEGTVGLNTFTISQFTPPLTAGTYQVSIEATALGQAVVIMKDFSVTTGP